MLSGSLFLKALRREKTERPPIWFMRQAGRYLPEYRELRKQHRMLEMITTPELASRVTLQPIERFELDAAIIFADILNPLIGMGVELDFIEGEGPKIFNPICDAAGVERLSVPDPRDTVGYTLEAIGQCVKALQPRGIPLIGFAGAPFTLSCYLIEQGEFSHMSGVKRFMLEQAPAWHLLQEKLTSLVAKYLIAQAEAGASALQVFDSWAGVLSEGDYREFVLPHLARLFDSVRAGTDRPLIYFSTGTAGILGLFGEYSVDGISIDWRTPLTFARRILGDKMTLQGNLDPVILKEAGTQRLENAVRTILSEARGVGPYIFNLGHGILPATPIENVARVIELVRGASY